MANSYYTGTGVLLINKVTPVIRALFGAFNLDPTHPSEGQVYIANVAEDSDIRWSNIIDALRDVGNQLGILAAHDFGDDELDQDDIETLFWAFAEHYKTGSDLLEWQANMIDKLVIDVEQDADLEILFNLAITFNDGHGLTAIQWEGASTSDSKRLFHFGGDGLYLSKHCKVWNESSQPRFLGPEIDAAIDKQDYSQAAKSIIRSAENMLANLNDDAVRDAIKTEIQKAFAA